MGTAVQGVGFKKIGQRYYGLMSPNLSFLEVIKDDRLPNESVKIALWQLLSIVVILQ